MEGDTPPTWPHHTATLRSRHRQSPPLLNPVVLILLIPAFTLILIFLIIPSFISLTSNITIKPVSIKKGWVSLNILLVLLAVLCGIFAKQNDDDVSPTLTKSQPLDSDRWYECYEREPEKGGSRLRRNSSSYPDLRQASEWDNGYNQFRFFDDLELTAVQYNRHRVKRSEVAEKDGSDIKVVPVDTFEVVQPPPPSSPAEAPPPPEKEAAEPRLVQSFPKYRRKERDIELQKSRAEHAMLSTAQVERKRTRRQRIRSISKEQEKTPVPPQLFPPPTPAPPPPPPPPPSFYNIFSKRNKNKRVHSISRQPPPPPPPPPLPMSHIFNNMFKTGSISKRLENRNLVSVPPPPPLPPPRSIFNNMFKTGSKSKKFQNRHSSSAPPPPPPPPPRSIFNNMFKTGSKSKRFQKQHYTSAPPLPPPPLPPMSSVFNDLFNINLKSKSNRYEYTAIAPPPPPPPPRQSTVSYGRPPLPAKTINHNEKDENPFTGAESPLISIPRPPPLPPFRMPESGFVARGDFVRIRSTHNSRCSSPDLEDVDLSSYKMNGGDGSARSDLSSNKMDGEDGLGHSITCPSPDVNSKADSFIARLKEEWKLEKMNSIKKKQLSPRNATSPKSY